MVPLVLENFDDEDESSYDDAGEDEEGDDGMVSDTMGVSEALPVPHTTPRRVRQVSSFPNFSPLFLTRSTTGTYGWSCFVPSLLH